MPTNSSVGGVRRKKRVSGRSQVYRSDNAAPTTPAPASNAAPPDLLGRLLLPAVNVTPQQPHGRLYFSSLVSPAVVSSASSVDDGRDASNQEHEESLQHFAVASASRRGRRECAKDANLVAFQKKYGKDDALVEYALRVIRDGLAVRRSEIPRYKNVHHQDSREQCTPEDALYLTYSPTTPCGFRNVYWLAFIDESEAVDPRLHQRDYFALTCHGLTHFEAGAATEFVDLTSWVHEKRAFDHMTSMRGLERIQQMLFFFSWKRKAIKNKHKRVQAHLHESLFGCHAVAARVLQRVRMECLEIEEWMGPPEHSGGAAYTLAQFEKVHQDRLDAARTFIHEKVKNICEVISREVSLTDHPVVKKMSFTPTNLANLTTQLEAANLRERLFPFLRRSEFQLAEAVRTHCIVFLRGICHELCGVRRDPSQYSPINGSVKSENASLLYAQIVGAIDTDKQVSGAAPLEILPTKETVFELLHSIFARYLSEMDTIPRLLMDSRFEHVLTPFEPSFRPVFCRALTKPSSLVFEACAADLTQMRDAVDDCYQHVERIRADHFRCTRAIKVAETTMAAANSDYMLPLAMPSSDIPNEHTTSATAHEAALKTWNRFMQYADLAEDILHVGFLLVDQGKFVSDLRDHVARHLVRMNELLPKEYQALLQSLVDDVDARIDRVTKVPGSLESAAVWIDQVIDMLPTHPQRQLFDAKCRNLARLKALVKERTAMNAVAMLASASSSHARATDHANGEDTVRFTLQQEQQQQLETSIRKLEVAWESIYETLLLCLDRVQDRNGVHRRSIDDLTSKTEEYIGDQLHQILTIFANLPTGIEDEPRLPQQTLQTQIVSRLEDLVELDIDRSRVVKRYTIYECEYRMVCELPSDQWVTTLHRSVNNNSSKMRGPDKKLPTEMLLQYAVTAFELRQWFVSWSTLRRKWEVSPVLHVHPGTILDRIKQFRKRVVVSAKRMHRWSAALLKTPILLERLATKDTSSTCGFATPDFTLIRAFRTSIDDMTWFSKMFQAVNSESFANHHWEQLQRLLTRHFGAGEVVHRDQLTLHQLLQTIPLECVPAIREKTGENIPGNSGSGNLGALMEFFDECIIESRLHAQLKRSRQRLTRVHIRICEENYTVRCDGVDNALRELDSILMDVKLCLYQQNPELQACMETCAEVERYMSACEFILQFQRKWLPMFDWLKLHDVDDFVVTQQKLLIPCGGSGGSSSQAPGCSDESTWKAFTAASQRWSDCMRRIYFAQPKVTKRASATGETSALMLKSSSRRGGSKASTNLSLFSESLAPENEDTDGSGVSKRRDCSLEELTSGFQDFDFEHEIASCEHGMTLVNGYLSMLRGKSPRLLLVEDSDLLYLLTHDQDIPRFHHVLTRCFSHVGQFSIKRCNPHYDLDLDGSAPTSDNVRLTDDAATSILVDGVIDTRRALAATWTFRMPVTKIGRVTFWLSRIEEETAAIVRGNARAALRWIMSSAELYPDAKENVSDMGDVSLPPPQQLLLPQSITVAAIFWFSYELARLWTRESHTASDESTIDAIRRLDDLSRRLEMRINGLIILQRNGGSNVEHSLSHSTNTENLLLLLRYQAELLRHITQLLRSHRDDDARFFWSMQFKVYICQLSSAALSVGAAGGRQGPRAERVLLSSDSDAAVANMKSRDLETVEMYAQVAHIELSIGHEFTGWSRIPVLSPLSQRCAFALFSAVRASKSPAMIAPYSEHSNDVGCTLSAVTMLAQLLMTPLLQIKCSPRTTSSDVVRLDAHLNATLALNAMLIIRDFALLNSPSQLLIQERLVHRSLTDHGAVTQSNITNTSAAASPSLRFNGAPPLAGPAVIIPFMTHRGLQRSGLLDAIQHRIRAVAVPSVAIGFLVESLLLPHGYSHEQALRTGATNAFEALATSAFDFQGKCSGVNVRSMIPKVIGEAMRLRASYRVIFSSVVDERHPWDSSSPRAKQRPASATSPRAEQTESEALERRVDQTVFRIALQENVELLLAGGDCKKTTQKSFPQFLTLVDALFPYASQTRAPLLQLKRGEIDDAVANAVEICLEESGLATRNSHHNQKQQIERIMYLWKILQAHNGVIVHGPGGSGKSTSIKVLHRALTGLALASKMDGADTSRTEGGDVRSETSTLTVLNSGVLSFEQLYAETAQALLLSGTSQLQQAQPNEESSDASIQQPRWILVDGALDSALLERIMTLSMPGDRSNNGPDGSYPATSVMRSLSQPTQANGARVCRSRIIFESIDLCELSPLSLTHSATINIPASCIMYEDIVFAWKRQWEKRLRITASVGPSEECGNDDVSSCAGIGSQRLALLFKTIDILLLDICVPFVVAENAHRELSTDMDTHSSPSNALGGLPFTHMASTALKLLELWSFPRNMSWCSDDSSLLPRVTLTEMAAFAVLWGFSGHLPHAMQHKLEYYLRSKLKDSLELRHLSDAHGSLFDSSRFDEWNADDDGVGSAFADEWAMQSSRTAFESAMKDNCSSGTPTDSAVVASVFDPSSGHLIALLPVALSLVRVCSRLIHAGASFMLVGPAASGKTSLLRWLIRANDEAQTAEMLADRALDQRQAHAVLDWLGIPASWFKQPTTASATSFGLSAELRTRAREENGLLSMLSACSFVFVDDLCVESTSTTDPDEDSLARIEFLRSILDHGLCYSSQRGALLRVHRQIGAAMRLNGDSTIARRNFPSSVSRLLRHFIVLHTPVYSQKDLLSVFRTKFHTDFDATPNAAGTRASPSRPEASSTVLTAQEVILRASADWMTELSTVCDTIRAQGIDANTPLRPGMAQMLTFNWHHISDILDRSLAYARELSSAANGETRDSNTSTSTGTYDRQSVTLVELGQLHQSWVSELQNVFLANWPPHGSAQLTNRTDPPPTAASASSNSDELDFVGKKLWSIVRLLSEKYFSAGLQDDSALPISVSSAYFSLCLVVSHPLAPLLQDTHVPELRDLLTALASSAPSVGALVGSTRGSAASLTGSSLTPNQRHPTVERVVGMLVKLAGTDQVTKGTSDKLQVASSHGNGASSSLSDNELFLLFSSSTLLAQCLHVVHALGRSPRPSPLLVLSARHGLAIPYRLATFACSLHGFQIQRIGRARFTESKQEPYENNIPGERMQSNGSGMRSLLVDVLFAVGVQHKRIALWIDWKDLLAVDDAVNAIDCGFQDNDAVLLLLALIEELCLGQVPTLVLDQGRTASGVTLRDAILMGCIQDKQKMETASEAELLHDFCLRMQRNLRICIFDTGREFSGLQEPAMRGYDKRVAARICTLRSWMCTRASCKILQLGIKRHEIASTTTAMAEKLTVLMMSDLSGGGRAMASSQLPLPWCAPECLTALHENAMSFAICPEFNLEPEAIVPEHSIEYFLSFMVNLFAQWRRMVLRETNIHAQCQQMIEHFDTVTTVLLPQVGARRALLDNRIQDLARDESIDDPDAEFSVVHVDNDVSSIPLDDTLSIAEVLAAREYRIWCRRTRCEERDLMRCELEAERRTLTQFMEQWQYALPRAKETLASWQEAVKARETTQFWNMRLRETISRAVGISYSFVSALENDCKTSFMSAVQQILADNRFGQADISSSKLGQALTENDGEGERNSNMGGLVYGPESDAATRLLANLLVAAELPLLRHERLLEVLRAGCDVVDRIPVFTDPTGVFQRLFVRCFSGQQLIRATTNDPGRTKGIRLRGDGKESAASRSRSQQHQLFGPASTVIVSSDAPDLENQLTDAQRRNVPVLLVDFRPSDQLGATLSPFRDAIKRNTAEMNAKHPSTYPFCGVLENLAVESCRAHSADRNSRRRNRRTASVTIGSITAEIGARSAHRPSVMRAAAAMISFGGTATLGIPTQGRRNNMTLKADNLGALGSTLGQQRIDTSSSESYDCKHHGQSKFQIVAIASNAIDLSTQYQHAHDYAFYDLGVDKHVLGRDFFTRLWITHTNRDSELLQCGVRESERVVADCCTLVADSREKLWTTIGERARVQPSKSISHSGHIPLASVAATLEFYNRMCDVLVELDQHERRLALSFEQLEQKRKNFDEALAGYHEVGVRLASLSRCFSILPTLLPAPNSLLYKWSSRWIEYRVAEELSTGTSSDVDSFGVVCENRGSTHETDVVKIEAVVQRIIAGVGENLISRSHRRVLLFLEAIGTAISLTTLSESTGTSDGERHSPNGKPLDVVFLWRALSWLSSKDVALVASPSKQQAETLPRQASELARSQHAISFVDRLRRKMRLGILLVDCFSANSRGSHSDKGLQQHQPERSKQATKPYPAALSSNPASSTPLAQAQDTRQRRHPVLSSAKSPSLPLSNEAANSERQKPADELEAVLTALFTVVENFWIDWKAAKQERRRDLERLLAAHGVRRARRASLRRLEITAAVTAAASASAAASSVPDASATVHNTVRVQTTAEVLAEFNLYDALTAGNDHDRDARHDSLPDSLAKLLLTYAFFPNVSCEATADWCELVASCRRVSRTRRKSISTNNPKAGTELDDQSDIPLTAIEREATAEQFGSDVPSAAYTAFITDVAAPNPSHQSVDGKANKSPLMLLPKCLVVYAPSADAPTQRRAEKWLESMSASTQTPRILTWWRSNKQTRDEVGTSRYYYDRLVELVTSSPATAMPERKQSQRFFAVDLLDPTHLDAAVEMISRVVSEHALLAAPTWIVVCSLDVAARISSSKLPLLPRVLMNGTDVSESTDVTPTSRMRQLTQSPSTALLGPLLDGVDPEVLAEHMSWLQSGLSVRDENDREHMQAALARCLMPQRQIYQDGEDGEPPQINEQDPIAGFDPASIHTTFAPSLAMSSAALSCDLTADLVAARHSILSMVSEGSGMKNTETPFSSQAPHNSMLQRVDVVFAHLRQTADALDAAVVVLSTPSPASELLLFPWCPLQREVETQTTFFRTIDMHLRALRSQPVPQLDLIHSTFSACISRGFIPLQWIEAALDDARRATRGFSSLPSWPMSQVAIAQLALLLAYRFALLADWLSSRNRRVLTRALDLASIHDARGVLRDLKHYFANYSGVPSSDVAITLELDEDDPGDGSDFADNSALGLGAAIRRRGSDGTVVVEGLRVEGVVLLELERSSPGIKITESPTVVAFHALPLCRLMCRVTPKGSSRTQEDTQSAQQPSKNGIQSHRVPLVMLASVSPFRTPSTPDPLTASAPSGERIDWVELELDPSAIGIPLQQERYQGSDQDALTTDRKGDRIGFALGVPLFATDDNTPT